MDKLHQIGGLGLASRLKRLSEKLSKDVTLVYKKQNIDFEARWFSIVYLLKEKSPMRITDLAHSLNISHTAVNQLASELIKKNYIRSGLLNSDDRVKLLYLTGEGKKLCVKLAPLWKVIKQANDELLATADGNLLEALENIESALEKKSMYERIMFRLNGSYGKQITICEYNQKLKKHFNTLNREWLEEYFEVEKSDEEVLADPNSKIIKKGGKILFAYIDEHVAGTCALIKHAGDRYELAKMAVSKKYRGQGIGKVLLDAAVSAAAKLGANELYLQTNMKLKAANRIYKERGFEKTKSNPFGNDNYRRETYAMKLILSKP